MAASPNTPSMRLLKRTALGLVHVLLLALLAWAAFPVDAAGESASSSSSSGSSSGSSVTQAAGKAVEDSLKAMEFPYAKDAIKNLFSGDTYDWATQNMQQYANKATESLKQLSTDTKSSEQLRKAAMEALKSGDIDKVMEVAKDAKETGNEELRQVLGDYGSAYQNFVDFFWELSPIHGGGRPSGKLGEAINQQFGSFDEFKKKFSEQASSIFGSGWVWLVSDKSGKLSFQNSRFQERPSSQYKVIIALDCSDILYYLQFKNDKQSYVNTFFNFLDWNLANERYEHALEGKEHKVKRGWFGFGSKKEEL